MQLADTLHRSRATSVMLKSGLNLIQQGLSIYGDDLKLIFANRQFGAMFALPASLCEPGADFAETIWHLATKGEYGEVGDLKAFVDQRVRQALTFEQHYMERERANGQWVSVEGGPLRQGGWVTVYTDITEVRRQEEMLRSRSDELSDRLLDRSEELARTNRALEATINRLHETQQHLEAAEARIRLAAETTPAHIARLDLDERYTYTNQRLPLKPANGAENIVGHTAREVLGAPIYDAITPALRSAMSGEPKVVEFTDPQSGYQIRAAFTPDTNAANAVTGVYVLSMDITHSNGSEMQAASAGKSIARFGEWTAKLESLELISKPPTPPVHLTLAEAALLRAFLENANRVISRAEVHQAVPGPACSDRTLDVRIARLRQKLKDPAKSPRLLRTIYGAGYVFTADVEWIG
ncbi:PAS-domain containing protein [Yoonia sp. BS5-3]|uniref:PAS-domain containing protein n=1 Tax=Yoonia phaeophyticola TaxID=3137369 RepID=A0ABZ2V3Y8_9RHOB